MVSIRGFLLLGCLLHVHVRAQDADAEEPIVTTKYGRVRGTTLTTRNGESFLAFRGIPYAKPPIGSLRFKVNKYLIYNNPLFPEVPPSWKYSPWIYLITLYAYAILQKSTIIRNLNLSNRSPCIVRVKIYQRNSMRSWRID